MFSRIRPSIILVSLAALVALSAISLWRILPPKKAKVYWFIPDGVRAEPNLFQIYQWAEEGTLPNLRRLMQEGSYGYSIPLFPSHTPTNFATLLTGLSPKAHGIADGPMHVEGFPLAKVSAGGFQSLARKVPAIWTPAENAGYKVALLSVPGSTPPELKSGIVVRGRWGNWGPDPHSLIFEGKKSSGVKNEDRLFYFGAPLTISVDSADPKLSAWGYSLKLKIVESTPPLFEFLDPHGKILARLKIGEWSDWLPAHLSVGTVPISSFLRVVPIALSPSGEFRVRVLVDSLNRFLVQPTEAFSPLHQSLGPMVDFVDNYPAQLIRVPEDKQIFLDEMQMSFQWHQSAVAYALGKWKSDFIIHDIYSPNQMLTSRWWMGRVDPESSEFASTEASQRAQAWQELKAMYVELDKILGEILKNSEPDSYIVFSSDHGACALNRSVHVNTLLKKHKLLFTKFDRETKQEAIDWEKSRAMFLQMNHVFIHPQGLGGKWARANGAEYEKLRDQVAQILRELRDKNGKAPLEKIIPWEEAASLGLPNDRIGDLVLVNHLGYSWSESLNGAEAIFSEPAVRGYKQAISPQENSCAWTPFLIRGPGIKAGYALPKPIDHRDQAPTLAKILGISLNPPAEGRVLHEIFEK